MFYFCQSNCKIVLINKIPGHLQCLAAVPSHVTMTTDDLVSKGVR